MTARPRPSASCSPAFSTMLSGIGGAFPPFVAFPLATICSGAPRPPRKCSFYSSPARVSEVPPGVALPTDRCAFIQTSKEFAYVVASFRPAVLLRAAGRLQQGQSGKLRPARNRDGQGRGGKPARRPRRMFRRHGDLQLHLGRQGTLYQRAIRRRQGVAVLRPRPEINPPTKDCHHG